MKTESLLERLQGVRETAENEWIAMCPAHADKTPSLSIKHAKDATLLHCFAGCSACDVLSAIGLRLADLYDKPLRSTARVNRRRYGQAADCIRWLEDDLYVMAFASLQLQDGIPLSQSDIERLRKIFARVMTATEVVK